VCVHLLAKVTLHMDDRDDGYTILTNDTVAPR
jgi:hypothetical protein